MNSAARSNAVIFAVLFFSAMQMIPVALNGYPLVFFDTRGYYNAGEAAVGLVFGNDNPTTIEEQATTTSQPVEPKVEGVETQANSPQLSLSRSPYYGVLLYLFYSVSPFLVVALQSLAIASVAWLTVRSIVQTRPLMAYLAAGAVCMALTPLPYFAAYLMPDVFSAVVPLGFFLLAWKWSTLARSERLWLWLLLSASLLFHTTHILLAVGLVVFAGVMALWPSLRPSGRGWVVATTAVGAGIFGVVVFGVVIRIVFGVDPVNPPFLTARGLEDGPVIEMIQSGCDKFAVCAADPEVDSESQAFLWGPDGLYFDADSATRQRLSEEDLTVFFSAALRYPMMQILASLSNSADQAVMFGLYDFATATEVLSRSAPNWMPANELMNFESSAVANDRFPLNELSVAVYITVGAAALALLWLALAGRIPRSATPLLLIVLAVLLGNAILGGALSDAHHRYQARLIWLVPFLALVLCLDARSTRAT